MTDKADITNLALAKAAKDGDAAIIVSHLTRAEINQMFLDAVKTAEISAIRKAVDKEMQAKAASAEIAQALVRNMNEGVGKMIRNAVEAEREACAKIVEKYLSADAIYPEGLALIADAIRARGSKDTTSSFEPSNLL